MLRWRKGEEAPDGTGSHRCDEKFSHGETNTVICAHTTKLFHKNLQLKKILKQFTANYVQIPLNRSLS